MSKLYIIEGPKEGQPFDITDETVFVGRNPENDIQIDDNSVSRKHLKISQREGKFFIQDLMSRNGTFVNGQPLRPGQELEAQAGHPITMGSVQFSLETLLPEYEGTSEYKIDLMNPPKGLSNPSQPGDLFLPEEGKAILTRTIIQAVMEVNDMETLCDRVVAAFFAVFQGLETCGIFLTDHKQGGEPVAVVNRVKDGSVNEPSHSTPEILMQVLKDGKAIAFSNPSEDQGGKGTTGQVENGEIVSSLGIPLIGKAGVQGAVYARTRGPLCKQKEEELLFFTTLGTTLALAMDNLSLSRKRQKATEYLQKWKEKHQALVNQTWDALVMVQNGTICYANPRAAELSGYTLTEMQGIPFVHLFHPDDREGIREDQMESARGAGLQQHQLMDKGGKKIWCQMGISSSVWEGHPAVLYSLRDITDLKKAEEKQLEKAKAEAVESLAQGISLDLNNLLMTIQGNTSLILSALPDEAPYHEKLKHIESCVARAAELVEQFSGLAGSGKFILRSTNLHHLITKTSENFALREKRILVYREYKKGPLPVEIDRRQLESVLSMLYDHGARSMPGGGEILIRTEEKYLGQDETTSLGISPGRYARLSIQDTGVGMDEITKKHLFDPFFTTQKMGRGIGVGLAFVYGVIRSHGGTIDVISDKGKGTTFDIYLPSSAPVGEIQTEASDRDEEEEKAKGTILLIDDEEMILDVGKQMLTKLGYRVLLARSGNEALTLYKKEHSQIGLLILDLNLSDMDGKELLNSMISVNPHLKALIADGFQRDDNTGDLLDQEGFGIIHKPFDLDMLSKEIQRFMQVGTNHHEKAA
jgi:PAS domain S-box-containing protein